jgi:hypothetical protein
VPERFRQNAARSADQLSVMSSATSGQGADGRPVTNLVAPSNGGSRIASAAGAMLARRRPTG